MYFFNLLYILKAYQIVAGVKQSIALDRFFFLKSVTLIKVKEMIYEQNSKREA